VPISKETVVVETPWVTVEVVESTLEILARASSMGRVIWVSISAGAAPDLGDGHRHSREGDVRVLLNRQLEVGEQAEQDEGRRK
jgi:hypothetical protein